MPGNIGWQGAIIILIVLLVVFGPKRLPEMGRSLGRGMREFKDSVTGKDDDDEPRELLPGEADFALAADHAADGAQRGRLARAIGAEQNCHAAFLDRDIDPVHDFRLAVEGLEAVELEDRRHQCRVPR